MNETFYPINDYRNYLAHYGVKGMKWGVRHDRVSTSATANRSKTGQYEDSDESSARKARIKKTAIVVGAVVGTAAVVAGAYAARKYLKGTMSEAEDFMVAAKESKMDRMFDEFMKSVSEQERATMNYEHQANLKQYERDPAGWEQTSNRLFNANATTFAKKHAREAYRQTADERLSSGKYKRAAQRALMRRDLANIGARTADARSANQKLAEDRIRQLMQDGVVRRRR